VLVLVDLPTLFKRIELLQLLFVNLLELLLQSVLFIAFVLQDLDLFPFRLVANLDTILSTCRREHLRLSRDLISLVLFRCSLGRRLQIVVLLLQMLGHVSLLETEEFVLNRTAIILIAHHLLLIFILRLLVELLQRNNLLAQVRNLLNQLLILNHDVLIVLFVKHVFLLKALLKLLVRALKVFLLVQVLFLNVGVDVGGLCALSLNEVLQLLLHFVSHEVDICNVLHDFIHCTLEALDLNIVLSNLGTGCFDQLKHLFLLHTKVIYSKAECAVRNVELAELIVHLLSGESQCVNLGFTRRDIPLKLFNLVIKHELELF